MELVDKRVDTSAQSWTRRAEGRHPPKVDYCSELGNWVQRAILEAEKNEDFNKEDQLEPSKIFEIDQEWFLK